VLPSSGDCHYDPFVLLVKTVGIKRWTFRKATSNTDRICHYSGSHLNVEAVPTSETSCTLHILYPMDNVQNNFPAFPLYNKPLIANTETAVTWIVANKILSTFCFAWCDSRSLIKVRTWVYGVWKQVVEANVKTCRGS